MRGKYLLVFVLFFAFLTNSVQGKNNLPQGNTSSQADAAACIPGSGWRWMSGPDSPDTAKKVAGGLTKKGIQAGVQAAGYGEMDSCGTYRNYGVDFDVKIKNNGSQNKAGVSASVLAAVSTSVDTNLGNVIVHHTDGSVQNLTGRDRPKPNSFETASVQLATTAETAPLTAGSFYRKAYVIVINPQLTSGQSLIDYMRWSDPNVLAQQTIDFFKTSSHGQLQYQVAASTLSTQWPVKADGFSYTEATYLAVLADHSLAHSPDLMDYYKVLSAPDIDICGRANRGEIDEVWLYGAPWMGFWESTLVGPGAYIYNSYPVAGAWTCNRLIPVMGFSYERQISEVVEDFGHRSEATMSRTYGGWQENRTAHNWDRFGLVDYQSPDYAYSGCGSVHYPANGVHDYDWSNTTPAPSYCDDFAQYPNLPSPPTLQNVDCSTWGCSGIGYFQYWFSHIPHFPGCGPDNVSNMWWNYLATPALANTPRSACALAPQLYLNQASGAPGSTFTIRGTNFPPGSTANLSVNNYSFTEPVPTDDFGNFVILLQTSGQAAPGTYLVAVNAGTSAAFTLDPSAALISAEGTAQTYILLADAPRYLPAPSNLAAAPLSQAQINLTWTDNAANETGYFIEQSQDAGITWTEIAQVGVNSTAYTITNLACSTSYAYRVRAYRAGDATFSDYSNTANAATSACTPLAAPANLTAAPVSLNQINLSWADRSTGETNFRIERSSNGTTGWIEAGTAGANSTAYSDTGLACGTRYYYRVRGYRSVDNSFSPYSTIANAITQICPLAAPSNLTASAISRTKITLSWKDNSTGETNFRVERSANGISGWSEIAAVKANVITYSNSLLTCGTVYYYRVRGYRSSDNSFSAYSAVASTSTLLCPLAAPTSLVVTSATSTQISISWLDNAADETSYRIERTTNTLLGWNEIASVPANTTTYTDSGLTHGVTYYYRVRAYRSADNTYSSYSNRVSKKTPL